MCSQNALLNGATCILATEGWCVGMGRGEEWGRGATLKGMEKLLPHPPPGADFFFHLREALILRGPHFIAELASLLNGDQL